MKNSLLWSLRFVGLSAFILLGSTFNEEKIKCFIWGGERGLYDERGLRDGWRAWVNVEKLDEKDVLYFKISKKYGIWMSVQPYAVC